MPLDDIRHFRQLDSRCPGHPEHGHTSGVETTTGPLGQGIGNSVGMAIASRWLAARYNRPGFDLFDFNVYALCSDGDLMEGVGGEAASLAGHLKLSNLCWIYDDNTITIEGHTVAGLQRGRGHAVRRLRLERAQGGRRQRPGRPCAPRWHDFQQDDRPADADHRPQRDRLGRPEQAQHARRPRRPAGRGGSPPDQGGLRLAGDREVPRARRSAGPFPRRTSAPAASSSARHGKRRSPSMPGSSPSWPRNSI